MAARARTANTKARAIVLAAAAVALGSAFAVVSNRAKERVSSSTFASSAAGESVQAATPVVDAFHPDRAPRADGSLPPLPKPAYGGRAILQVESMPKSLNAAIDGM